MLKLSSYEFSTFFSRDYFLDKKRYETTLMKLQITLSVKFSLNENRGKFVLSLNNKLKLNKTKKLKSESQNFYRLSLNPHVPVAQKIADQR